LYISDVIKRKICKLYQTQVCDIIYIGDDMKITKMKKIPGGRYKLTLDDNKALTLYEDVIVKNILLLGKDIDSKLLNNINEDNMKSTIYNQALNYIDIRRRGREEIYNYLAKKNYDITEIDRVIKRLEEENYINDYDFTVAYINDKLNMSNDGINKIRRSLSDFKIEESVINEVLSKMDLSSQDDKIDRLINKQKRLNSKYTGNVLKSKILNYLINLGYDRDSILDKLENASFDNKKDIQKEYQKLYKKYSNKYSGYKLDMTIKQKLYQKGYSEVDLDVMR
jgi:regulatory protein